MDLSLALIGSNFLLAAGGDSLREDEERLGRPDVDVTKEASVKLRLCTAYIEACSVHGYHCHGPNTTLL